MNIITGILLIFGVYLIGMAVGMYLNRCRRTHLDETPLSRVLETAVEAPSFAETYKARAVRRPSAEKLADKRKPKRVKETEQAMEELLDTIV